MLESLRAPSCERLRRRPRIGPPVSDDGTHCMIRNKTAREAMVRLLRNARYEVLPVGSTEEKVLTHLPKDRTVTVTASPTKGLDPTFALAESLTRAGYLAVPHIAARMVSGRGELKEICDRLTESGIDTVFVPGGDRSEERRVGKECRARWWAYH